MNHPTVSYSLGPLTPDQLNFLHAAPTSVLVAVAAEAVNLNELAKQELANRGCDMAGVFVGFRQAAAGYRDTHPHP